MQQQQHADRPAFHLAPRQGWLNDPNGPLYYNGKYHMFYQHLVQGCEWAFGIVWGHAVSTDLVHWERLPEALVPTPGGVDADGCFSGCATVDNDGRPIILFTGVRLRSNPECGPLPPTDRDLQLPFIESQCYAVADPGCDNLSVWHKAEMPFISLPPPGVATQLAGWRDPYIIHRGDGETQPWVMLLGSGIKGRGGTALMYSSWDLLSGWQYMGMLACGDGETGAVWECPILALLPPLQPVAPAAAPQHAAAAATEHVPAPLCAPGCSCPPHSLPAPVEPEPSQKHPHRTAAASEHATGTSEHATGTSEHAMANGNGVAHDEYEGEDEEVELPPHSWLFCISPDAPTNPTLYWLGDYDGQEFHVNSAQGPWRLDLGDILYAPNTLEDPQGRLLLWGWLQERRKVGAYDYAGCLTVPRMLHRHNGRLHQSPVPEIDNLRTAVSWIAEGVEVLEAEPVPLQRVAGCHLDVEVVLRRRGAAASGLLLRCFDTSVGEGDAHLLYHWERRHLEVVVEGVHPDTLEYSPDAPTARRMGGAVEGPEGDGEEEVRLRVLLDHSVLEVYLGTGEVLSTRVYLGAPPADCLQPAVEFVSHGGATTLARVAAYEVASIWERPLAPQPQEDHQMAAQQAAAHVAKEAVLALQQQQQQQQQVAAEARQAVVERPTASPFVSATSPLAMAASPTADEDSEEGVHWGWGAPLLREPTLALGDEDLVGSWCDLAQRQSPLELEQLKLLSLTT